MTEVKESQELLTYLFWIKGFQEADKNNYDAIRVKVGKNGIDIEK